MEEKAIWHSRHLDLIYSQSSTLYDIIPYAPRSLNKTTQLPTPFVGQLTEQPGHLTVARNPSSSRTTTKLTPVLEKTSEVNLVQSKLRNNPQQYALQGKHTILEVFAKVFNVVKLGIFFQNTFTTNNKGFSGGFRKYVI